jgi:Ca2+-binding EF-hand superfamily protein
MKRFTLGLIATAVLAVAAQDNQQTAERHKRRDPAKMFSRADTNSDGKMSLDEFLALRSRRTDTAQAQTDQTERRTAMFKRLDANADGFVTTDEFQAFASKHGRRQKPADHQQQTK